MSTYAFIFVASIVVAVIARVMYKSVSNASGSVYNTKIPAAELAHLGVPAKRKVKTDEGTDRAYPSDLRNLGTHAYLADDQKAQVVEEDAPHDWPDSVQYVPVDQNAGEKAVAHCSLFEDIIDEPAPVTGQKVNWPQGVNKPA